MLVVDIATTRLPNLQVVIRDFLDGQSELIEVILEGLLPRVEFRDVTAQLVHEEGVGKRANRRLNCIQVAFLFADELSVFTIVLKQLVIVLIASLFLIL